MEKKRTVFAINGSASPNSSNLALINYLSEMMRHEFHFIVFARLNDLPHFRTDQTTNNTPTSIVDFRNHIEEAAGILICTPEYVFSIPSGLKNAIEWCVSTTIFSNKPTAFITAAANGTKGHKELQLILKTIEADVSMQTSLLIQGIKGKLNSKGKAIDHKLENELINFAASFSKLISSKNS